MRRVSARNVASLANATAETNHLFTPTLVGFAPDSLICSAVNVSSESRQVTVQLVNGNGGALLNSVSGTINGGSTLSSTVLAGTGGIRAFCEITVANGVKSDVRGALALYSAANASDKDPIPAF